MSSSVTYIVLILLIFLSAFFSATETAFSTVNKLRLKKYSEDGNNKAKIACFISDNFDRSLTAILIGNNIVNIGASSLATVVAINLFGESGAAIATIVMTILILIFGEILPKSIANQYSEAWALTSATPLRWFMFICYPFSYIFTKIQSFIINISKKGSDKLNEPSVTEQELKYIVENIEEEGVLEKQESELVQSALLFDEKTVQEILTPRVDLVAIDIDDAVDVNINVILNSRYSRIPVYKSSVDKIIGIIHTKDLLNELINSTIMNNDGKLSLLSKSKSVNINTFNMSSLISPVLFVYKTKSLSALLNDFRKNKIHIAVVTDDYGGTLGIVTMEDLLEQLVGDIWDEDEVETPDFVKIDDYNYEISGDMPIRDMFDMLDFKPTEFECEHKTMGGWALQTFSKIPKVNDFFVFDNLTITVTQMHEQRITRMKVHYEESVI